MSIVLLGALITVLFIGMPLVFLMGRSRSSQRHTNQHGGGAHQQNAPPPTTHQPPAGAPPAGAHAPAAHPAPNPHAAPAAHGSGVGQWIKDHLWMVLPWSLVILSIGVLIVTNFNATDLSTLVMYTIVAIGLAIPAYGAIVTKSHRGVILAAQIFGSFAFIVTMLGGIWYIGMDFLHGPAATTEREGWKKMIAEATKAPEKNPVYSWGFPEITWAYVLPSLAFVIIAAFAFWPQTETKEKKGGHHS